MKIISRLRPADALTIVFLSSLIVLSVVFYRRIPRADVLIFTYVTLFLIQLSLIRKHEIFLRNRSLDMFRHVAFPVICVLVIFDSLGSLVHGINPRDVDPLLIRLDYLIFKGYPTVMLESFHNPLVTDLLQVAYTSYYFLPISFGVILRFKKRKGEFEQTVFLLLLCFYLSYVGYLLFPALGPRYTMQHLQSFDLGGMVLTGPVQAVLNSLEGVKRDAFPSGHTAVALMVSGLAHRFYRRFFYVTLPIVGMLIFSTVYCRYHYVVDVIGGVILATITFLIGDKYYGYWEARNSTDH